eukprot:TRINITY_DN10387_c0_g1_i1.p1 TRINITY_DN10387_c0_g1~~TRINITY_DN10387_c0_g1_i1.p1  ORF type:complete len:312 (+),score=49.33 TRINITY_DN10387_c0_g1_i1:39-974(+)
MYNVVHQPLLLQNVFSETQCPKQVAIDDFAARSLLSLLQQITSPAFSTIVDLDHIAVEFRFPASEFGGPCRWYLSRSSALHTNMATYIHPLKTRGLLSWLDEFYGSFGVRLTSRLYLLQFAISVPAGPSSSSIMPSEPYRVVVGGIDVCTVEQRQRYDVLLSAATTALNDYIEIATEPGWQVDDVQFTDEVQKLWGYVRCYAMFAGGLDGTIQHCLGIVCGRWLTLLSHVCPTVVVDACVHMFQNSSNVLPVMEAFLSSTARGQVVAAMVGRSSDLDSLLLRLPQQLMVCDVDLASELFGFMSATIALAAM